MFVKACGRWKVVLKEGANTKHTERWEKNSLQEQRNTHSTKNYTISLKEQEISSFCRIDHFFLILVSARSQIRRTRKVIWDGRRLHQSSMRTFFWSTLLTVFLRDVLASCKLYEQNTHQSWICQTIRLSFQFVRPFFLYFVLILVLLTLFAFAIELRTRWSFKQVKKHVAIFL